MNKELLMALSDSEQKKGGKEEEETDDDFDEKKNTTHLEERFNDNHKLNYKRFYPI